MHIDWPEYSRVHAARANLLIHLVAVPLFAGSFFSLIYYVVRGDWVASAIVAVIALLAMALQGRGHRLEAESPRPFTGTANFFRRWFTEQFFVYPFFVLSGRWWRQYRADGAQSAHES